MFYVTTLRGACDLHLVFIVTYSDSSFDSSKGDIMHSTYFKDEAYIVFQTYMNKPDGITRPESYGSSTVASPTSQIRPICTNR